MLLHCTGCGRAGTSPYLYEMRSVQISRLRDPNADRGGATPPRQETINARTRTTRLRDNRASPVRQDYAKIQPAYERTSQPMRVRVYATLRDLVNAKTIDLDIRQPTDARGVLRASVG